MRRFDELFKSMRGGPLTSLIPLDWWAYKVEALIISGVHLGWHFDGIQCTVHLQGFRQSV